MTDPKNIDEVLMAIQAERPVLTKDKKGQVGNQKTKYADLVQVNDVVLKLLNALSTIWTCRPHLEAGSFGLHYSLKHVPSNTEVTGVWPLKLSENPQQMGSATTYGRRYALLAVTGIVADDEDDDGDAAGGQRYAQRRSTTTRTAPAAAAATNRRTDQTKNALGIGDEPAARTAQRSSQPPLPGEEHSDGPTKKQLGMMHALFTKVEMTNRDDRLVYAGEIVGRTLASSGDLSVGEASKVIDKLKSWADQIEPPEGGDDAAS